MVALNILLVLLGFINSVNKKPKNADAVQLNIGEVVLSGWPGGPC
jgi:hypothetical protein